MHRAAPAAVAALLVLVAAPARADHDALAASWSFECGGRVAVDGSGHGNHGLLRGVTRVNGVHGSALGFPSDAVSPGPVVAVAAGPGTTLHVFDAGLTLEALVRPQGLPTPVDAGLTGLAYLLWADDDAYSLLLASDDRGTTTLRGGISCGRGAPGEHDVVTSAPFPISLSGTYSHLALTFASDVLRLFVNGELVAQQADGASMCGSRVGPVSAAREVFQIGSDDTAVGGTRAFHGDIDEVRVWARALSAEEILEANGRPDGPGTTGDCSAKGPACFVDVDCLDRDRCTVDRCEDRAACARDPVGRAVDAVGCEADRLRDPELCDDPQRPGAARLLARHGRRLLRVATRLANGPPERRVARLAARGARRLDKLERQATTGRLARRLDPACRTVVLDLVAEARRLLP